MDSTVRDTWADFFMVIEDTFTHVHTNVKSFFFFSCAGSGQTQIAIGVRCIQNGLRYLAFYCDIDLQTSLKLSAVQCLAHGHILSSTCGQVTTFIYKNYLLSHNSLINWHHLRKSKRSKYQATNSSTVSQNRTKDII